MVKGLAAAILVYGAFGTMDACADPQADFKTATLSDYIAECSAYSVQLCQLDLGRYVRARWADRHGDMAEETCTARAGNQPLSDSDLGRTIWAWLTAHQELRSTPVAAAFISAVDAVYPCVDGETARETSTEHPQAVPAAGDSAAH